MLHLVNKKYSHWFLIILGSLTWSLTMVKSGWTYLYGMGFWGPNGHDGVWHIALINSLSRGSGEMPTFSGEALKNYHIGFDLLLAFIHKVTSIPSHILYFQITPPIIALLIGYLTYILVKKLGNSQTQAFITLFFVYFGGSFGWLVTLIKTGQIGGESLFWAQQSISTLVNPPYALSLVLILAGLYFLLKFEDDQKKHHLIVASILIGLVGAVKVYAGILMLAGFGFISVIKLIKGKPIYIFSFIFSSLLSILFFNLLSRASGSLVEVYPFWFLETMMAVSDRVGWPKFYEAMINYKSGGDLFKGGLAYSVALIIFLVGNFGTRILGYLLLFRQYKHAQKYKLFEFTLLIMTLLGIFFTFIFVQKGTPWNTIQFVYYSLFFSCVLVGSQLGYFLEKAKNYKNIVLCIIIFLTLPTTVSTLWYNYLPSRPPAALPQAEIEALKYLESQPTGIVLTYPYDARLAEKAISRPPRPLYLYESTSYVSAYSNKPVYLEDEVNLEITAYDWKKRRESVEKFLLSNEPSYVRKFLKENNIQYVYWLKGQRAILGETQLGMLRIFENSSVDIYKVE